MSTMLVKSVFTARPCRKCHTLGGQINYSTGRPQRSHGYCDACNDEYQDALKIAEQACRDKVEVRLGTIPKPKELEANIKAVREALGLDEHAPKPKRAKFSAAEMKRTYFRAWRNIKEGWCSELATQRLTTAKILALKAGNLKDRKRAACRVAHLPGVAADE